MSFKSVNDILGVLETQEKWQEQPFQRLLKYWSEVVGAVVAAHTQPLSIQRDILQVATSSAVWAQNLTFERQKLVLKLNQKLSMGLVDIRFSTAQWQRSQKTHKSEETLLPNQHPSYVGDEINISPDVTPATQDANQAFQQWAKTVQARSRNLPLCPQCNCPTPIGELQRWRVCSLCAAKSL